jgi:arginyl-tRNA synthetase
LGSDGKAIKTHSGQPIRLQELADEAVSRARALVAAKNPSLDAASQEQVAQAVGLGAIRYADLSQNRSSDYTFEWDKLLAFDGNTAPYLLYAIARVYAIFRRSAAATAPLQPRQPKAQELNWPAVPPCPARGQPPSLQGTPFGPEERLLARHLACLPSTLELTLQELRPHYLCTYLYELAGLFSSFYNAHKVLVDDEALRQQRLLLCHRSLVVLATGAHLLGLEVLEQM